MKRVLVMGIGSRIMMDDAIGLYIVEDLKKEAGSSNITYVLGETDVDYCIEEAFNFDCIIVIDAFICGKEPGDITVVSIKDLNEKNEDYLYSMHGVHLLNILRRAKYFPDGILIGIEPYEINYGFTLSCLLKSCYSRILSDVHEQIEKYIDGYGGLKYA